MSASSDFITFSNNQRAKNCHWAMSQRLKPTPGLILARLSFFCLYGNSCFGLYVGSIQDLSRTIGKTARTTKKHLKALVDLGLISIARDHDKKLTTFCVNFTMGLEADES